MRKQRNNQQRNNSDVKPNRNYLRPSKILVLRPDIFNFNRLAGPLRRSLFDREEQFLDAIPKSAKTRTPSYFESAIRGASWNRPAFKNRFQILFKSVAVIFRHQRRMNVSAQFHRTFRKELFEVAPESIRDKSTRSSEMRYGSRGGARSRPLRGIVSLGRLRLNRQKINHSTRHRLPSI